MICELLDHTAFIKQQHINPLFNHITHILLLLQPPHTLTVLTGLLKVDKWGLWEGFSIQWAYIHIVRSASVLPSMHVVTSCLIQLWHIYPIMESWKLVNCARLRITILSQVGTTALWLPLPQSDQPIRISQPALSQVELAAHWLTSYKWFNYSGSHLFNTAIHFGVML